MGEVNQKKKKKEKCYSCQGVKSLQKSFMWRVPLGLGTVSSQKTRGQPLRFWELRCGRCLSPRSLRSVQPLAFWRFAPVGWTQLLRVKESESETARIIGFLEDIAFAEFCHRCTLWGVFCQKTVPFSIEKRQEAICCIR